MEVGMRSFARRFASALGFVLLASSLALAQEKLDKKYELGEELGSGTFKTVYTVKGHPELVIGVQHATEFGDYTPEQMASVLKDEKKMLDRLARAGVPTSTILSIGTFDGKPAYLQRRFETGDRAPDWYQKKDQILNETTIEDIHTIEDKLEKAHLDVNDAQFLVSSDGHIVVSDPLGIETKQDEPTTVKGVLDGIEQEAQQVIQARHDAAVAALAALPEASDKKIGRYLKDTQPPESARSAAGKAKLTEALLRYIETPQTTKIAQEVAAAIRKGDLSLKLLVTDAALEAEGAENEVRVALRQSFPKLAADIVREGAKRLHDGENTVWRDVVAGVHWLGFLKAKNVPAAAVPEDRLPARAEGAEPLALVELLAGESIADLTPQQRGMLAARAKQILDRAPVGAEPSATEGVKGILEEKLAGDRDKVER
jgi:hypothetical protein